MGKHDAIQWDEALEESILSAIESGKSLRQSAEDNGMTAPCIIRRKHDSEPFAVRYARAKTVQVEQLAEELVEIADTADKDTYNAMRLRVDTRKWLLSKLIPKVYGDIPASVNVQANLGIQLVHAIPRPDKGPSVPIPTATVEMIEEQSHSLQTDAVDTDTE